MIGKIIVDNKSEQSRKSWEELADQILIEGIEQVKK